MSSGRGDGPPPLSTLRRVIAQCTVLLGGGLRLLDRVGAAAAQWTLETATTMPDGAVALHHRRVR